MWIVAAMLRNMMAETMCASVAASPGLARWGDSPSQPDSRTASRAC